MKFHCIAFTDTEKGAGRRWCTSASDIPKIKREIREQGNVSKESFAVSAIEVPVGKKGLTEFLNKYATK